MRIVHKLNILSARNSKKVSNLDVPAASVRSVGEIQGSDPSFVNWLVWSVVLAPDWELGRDEEAGASNAMTLANPT